MTIFGCRHSKITWGGYCADCGYPAQRPISERWPASEKSHRQPETASNPLKGEANDRLTDPSPGQ